MENKLAVKFSDYLLKNNIIDEELYDVYVYGSELALSFIFTTIIIFTLGVLTKTYLQTAIHLIVFVGLRRSTGGFHASTHLRCTIITIAVYQIVVILSVLLNVSFIFYIVLLTIGLSTIIIMGPIENPNKTLSDHTKKKNKAIAISTFTILCITGTVLSFLSKPLGNSLFYSLASVIALMLITILQKGGKTNEKSNR